MPGRANRQRGLTLQELVVVLVLIAIVASIGFIVGSNSSPELSALSQAEKFAADLRYVQTLANAAGKPMGMALSADRGSYCYGDFIADNTDCFAVAATTKVDLAQKLAFSVGSTVAVSFNTLGNPSSAANYAVVFNGTTLSSICVESLTGYVKTNDCP